VSRPTEGARFLLERASISADGASATYRAVIFTPDADYPTTATLGEDGSAALGELTAPAELVEGLAMQARLLARGAAKRRADGLPAWPARVLRWRGPGRG
jgi:hypothetical protein